MSHTDQIDYLWDKCKIELKPSSQKEETELTKCMRKYNQRNEHEVVT